MVEFLYLNFFGSYGMLKNSICLQRYDVTLIQNLKSYPERWPCSIPQQSVAKVSKESGLELLKSLNAGKIIFQPT